MRKRWDAAFKEPSLLIRPHVGCVSVSPQTNVAAVGLLAQRGSAADGPEPWNPDHTDTGALNPDLIYPNFFFASKRVPGFGQSKFRPSQRRPLKASRKKMLVSSCCHVLIMRDKMGIFLQNFGGKNVSAEEQPDPKVSAFSAETQIERGINSLEGMSRVKLKVAITLSVNSVSL